MEFITAYVIVGFVFFIIGVFITRWIFKIETIIAYQTKQYMILRQIAHKLGVDEELIKEIDAPNIKK